MILKYLGIYKYGVFITLYNINYGKNKALFDHCKALYAYASFVNYVREAEKLGYENKISYALDKCQSNKLLPDYFDNMPEEDLMFLIGDYDYELDVKTQREEAFEDGEIRGRELNKLENAKNLLKEGIAVEIIARCTGLELEKVEALKQEV